MERGRESVNLKVRGDVTQVASAEDIGSSRSHMSFMRELDFIEQTKYGSSTLKKKEKLLTAQLQMVFTRTEFGFRRRAKQTRWIVGKLS